MKINYQDERDDDVKRIPMRVQEFGNSNSIRRERGYKYYDHFDTKISDNNSNVIEPEYVDLGLPSGNLWMKHPLGMTGDTDI